MKKKKSLIKRTVTKELLEIPLSPKYDLPSMSQLSSAGMLSSIPSPQEGVFAEQKRLFMGVDFVLSDAIQVAKNVVEAVPKRRLPPKSRSPVLKRDTSKTSKPSSRLS